MNAERTLNEKGKVSYDYDNDILYFKIIDREYDFSIELHNLVIDVDEEKFITGIRVFDASKVFGIPKISLRDIPEFNFKARIDQNIITVEFKFVARRRNSLKKLESTPVNQRITERIHEPLGDMVVTAVA